MSERAPVQLATEQSIAQAREIRAALIELHKRLLDNERAAYERQHGRPSSGEMLRLVVEDAQFAWLHTASQLIVSFDMLLDGKQPVTAAAVSSLVSLAGQSIQPSENGSPFQRKFHAAMQEDPDVIFAHRDTQEALARAKGGTLSSPARN